MSKAASQRDIMVVSDKNKSILADILASTSSDRLIETTQLLAAVVCHSGIIQRHEIPDEIFNTIFETSQENIKIISPCKKGQSDWFENHSTSENSRINQIRSIIKGHNIVRERAKTRPPLNTPCKKGMTSTRLEASARTSINPLYTATCNNESPASLCVRNENMVSILEFSEMPFSEYQEKHSEYKSSLGLEKRKFITIEEANKELLNSNYQGSQQSILAARAAADSENASGFFPLDCYFNYCSNTEPKGIEYKITVFLKNVVDVTSINPENMLMLISNGMSYYCNVTDEPNDSDYNTEIKVSSYDELYMPSIKSLCANIIVFLSNYNQYIENSGLPPHVQTPLTVLFNVNTQFDIKIYRICDIVYYVVLYYISDFIRQVVFFDMKMEDEKPMTYEPPFNLDTILSSNSSSNANPLSDFNNLLDGLKKKMFLYQLRRTCLTSYLGKEYTDTEEGNTFASKSQSDDRELDKLWPGPEPPDSGSPRGPKSSKTGTGGRKSRKRRQSKRRKQRKSKKSRKSRKNKKLKTKKLLNK